MNPYGSLYYDTVWTGWPRSSSYTYPHYWQGLTNDTWYKRNAEYSKGVLTWYQDYQLSMVDWAVDYTCWGAGGSLTGLTSYYKGTYAQKASSTCGYFNYYDRWSFTAPASEYAYVSIDTLTAKTTFDPAIMVTSGTCTCPVNWLYDGFTCSAAPSSGTCPSYKMMLTKGEEYDIFVLPQSACAGGWGSTIEYKIVMDTTGDPGLTLESTYAPRTALFDARIDGTATITP
jgi:hypothetical protein